jgi:ribonuclease PH
LDLNAKEASGGLELPIAQLAESGKVVMCEMDHKLPLPLLEPVLELAREGAARVGDEMRQALVSHMSYVVERRSVKKEEQE